jgi:L-rhamnose mutarotase
MKKFKRYCKTLQLKNDAALIAEYIKLHAMGNAWPEITQGMKDIGVIDMEIYLDGTTLFMIMDTIENFDHDKAMAKLATLPRQSEWEAAVSKYQKTSASTSAKEKWKLVERIYKMDQEEEFAAEKGYVEEIKMNN